MFSWRDNSTHIGLAVLAVLMTARILSACAYLTMRDAGFDEPRDMHRLCVLGREGQPEAKAVYHRLERWLSTDGQDLNLTLEYAAVDSPEMDWSHYGLPAYDPVPPTPAVALVQDTIGGTPKVLGGWTPAPTDEELEILLDSPFRKSLRQAVGRRLAVLVYMPEDQPDPTVLDTLAKVADEWQDKMDQHLGVEVITVDRSDPREWLLKAFTKEPSQKGDGPEGLPGDRVVVVFGRGKFLYPMLMGDDINARLLNEQLKSLMIECTCTQSASSLGADLVMIWNAQRDEAVVRLKTPDDAAVVGNDAAEDVSVREEAIVAELVADREPVVIHRVLQTLGVLAVLVVLAGVMILFRARIIVRRGN